MFRGATAVKLDEKGRLLLPTRYRESIRLLARHNNKMIATIDPQENCLLLYLLADWEELELKVQQLPSLQPAARRLQRLLIGHATELELDSQNRMLLPQVLREYADLAKDVMVVGQGKKCEIWNEQVWYQKRTSWLQEQSQAHGNLPEDLQNLSI